MIINEKSNGTKHHKRLEGEDFQVLSSGLLATSQGKIVVTQSRRREIMVQFHSHKLAGHMGIDKTLSNIKLKYFWPKMAKDVRDCVVNCLIFAKSNIGVTCKAPLQPIPVAEYIWPSYIAIAM